MYSVRPPALLLGNPVSCEVGGWGMWHVACHRCRRTCSPDVCARLAPLSWRPRALWGLAVCHHSSFLPLPHLLPASCCAPVSSLLHIIMYVASGQHRAAEHSTTQHSDTYYQTILAATAPPPRAADATIKRLGDAAGSPYGLFSSLQPAAWTPGHGCDCLGPGPQKRPCLTKHPPGRVLI